MTKDTCIMEMAYFDNFSEVSGLVSLRWDMVLLYNKEKGRL